MTYRYNRGEFKTADEFLAHARTMIEQHGYTVLTAWKEERTAYACSVETSGGGMYASPKVSYSWMDN